ncbi:MAG TPA: 3-phosphoshikimate 1-carboxyvinyltransferase [Coleofasciculaceae cyanobacterium]
MIPTLTLRPLTGPVQAEVAIPGSKSYTLRALLLAALVDKQATGKPVRLIAPLVSDDTTAMLHCLDTLGIRTESGTASEAGCEVDYIDVVGDLRDIRPGCYELNTDLSAASIRFLIALACIIPGEQILLGREGLNRRPVKPLVDSLRQMGAEIEYLEREGYPPVRVKSSGLNPGTVRVDGSISSQYISALLMIAPLVGQRLNEITIEIAGESISKPYIEMTLAIMQDFGISVHSEHDQKFTVPGGQTVRAEQYVIEADASSAAYFAAMAALTGSTITLKNLNPSSAQADMRFLQILAQMGNEIKTNENQVTVLGHGVKPIEVDMRDCPDQAQTLAVLAAFAKGVTKISGIRSLRIKETNRLEAVAAELAKMGIRTIAEEDALTIFGGSPQPAAIDTYGDHRMAMSFAVAGAVLDGFRINNPQVVGKTFPAFWEVLSQAGVGVEFPAMDSRVRGNDNTSSDQMPHAQQTGLAQSHALPQKIVLIGFMGAGKSLVAPLLAEKLGLSVVEMDQLVIERSGRASVKEIFEQDGESRFRTLEQEVAESLRHQAGMVISAGGGVILSDTIMKILGKNAILIHLDAALETILQRVKLGNGRPLLQNREQAEALYRQRAPLYKKYARFSVMTDHKSQDQIVDEILSALSQNKISEAVR